MQQEVAKFKCRKSNTYYKNWLKNYENIYDIFFIVIYKNCNFFWI